MTAEGKRPRTGGPTLVRDAAEGAAQHALAIWNPEQLQIVKDLICPGASDDELKLFALHCARTGLDPFSRQTYGIVRWRNVQKPDGTWHRVAKLAIQNAIDGLRLIAERTGKYGGQLGPLWCGPDGAWREVWLETAYPSAAKVAVVRLDWQQPLWTVARWDSYVQSFKDKQGQWVVSDMWNRMPDLMLAKVAESLALRKAFPQELSNVYSEDEMAQADRYAPPVRTADDAGAVIDGKAERVEPRAAPDGRPKAAPAVVDWFERNWANGIARARAIGVDPLPDPPDPATASRSDLEAACNALMDLIERRGRERVDEPTDRLDDDEGDDEDEAADVDPDEPF